jgi:hypothetical protein
MASKNWIAGAINPKTKGSFSADAKRAGKSTAEYADEKAGSKGKMGKKARLAQTLMSFKKG